MLNLNPEDVEKLFKSILLAWIVGIPIGGAIVSLMSTSRDSEHKEKIEVIE